MTILHESVKKVVPKAPRLDLLGQQALSKGLQKAGTRVPKQQSLYTLSLAGDLLANTVYYSLSNLGAPKNIWLRSTVFGVVAGVSAILLPKPLGLDEKYSNKTLSTKFMTIGLYVTGALVSAAVVKLMERKKISETKKQVEWERKLLTSSMG